jgi:hypothetical protein
MPEKEVQSTLNRAILDAIKMRVASLNVVSHLADDTDCYSKGYTGDAYAKNKCSIDLIGQERVLPPFTSKLFGSQESPR